MSHFSSKNWVDFVRGVCPAQLRALIESHLEVECGAWQRDSRLWRLVSECLGREPGYQVPESVLRMVKAEFRPEKPLSWLGQFAEMGRLVFDSWEHPGAVVARASTMEFTRQVIHEASPFVIDLRIEYDPVSRGVLLAGQVVDSLNAEQDLGPVEVILLRGDRQVAETSANPSGEFDLGFAAEEELRLFINIRGQRAIGIVLPEIERGNVERT
jgi:hypothetical protein